MGVKGDRGRGEVVSPGALDDVLEHDLVTAVDAVEHADRQRCGPAKRGPTQLRPSQLCHHRNRPFTRSQLIASERKPSVSAARMPEAHSSNDDASAAAQAESGASGSAVIRMSSELALLLESRSRATCAAPARP